MIKFITGNAGKVDEMERALFPIKIQPINIDLDEIQELDPLKIVSRKLKEALKHQDKDFFVEDTSVYFKGLGKNLPGPFMKWFLQDLKPAGLYQLAKKLGNTQAEMRSIIAYAKSPQKIYYFVGSSPGQIVKPKGSGGFGVDVIFQPKESRQTLSELKATGHFELSSRYKAAQKFKKFLLKHEQAKRVR